MILYTGAVYVLISWSGAQYVRAEIPRIGNENILNGLKEAVFVVDEDSRYILFQNSAAQTLNSRESHVGSFSVMPDKNEIFDMSEVQFAPFSLAMVENGASE